MTVALPAGLFVITNKADIDRLRNAVWAPGLSASAFVPLEPDMDLPPDAVGAAHVIVLEVDPTSNGSLRRLARLRSERPNLPIIAALRDANVALVRMLIRQGVTDVAVLPFEPDDLLAQVLDAITFLANRTSEADLAPLTTVVRSTGGSGATTIVTHLADALAQTYKANGTVCVIDLDLQSGDVASFLGQAPGVTVASLLEAGDRLDAELLRGAVMATEHGFSIIAAPEAITPLETVDTDQLLKLLTIARREFSHVIVDLPAAWTNWALSVASASGRILVVAEPSIASLRQAKRRIDLLASVGIENAKVQVVLNRVERRLFKSIGRDDVQETLMRDVVATLHLENSALTLAQDRGMLLSETNSKSRFCNDVRGLAQSIYSGRE